VFADDRLIDRIAQSPWEPVERAPSAGGAHRREAGRPAYSELATADPLAGLFETWRDELAANPMPPLPRLRPALVPQAAERPAKRRSMRPALSIAAAIAALLVGSATIGSKNAAPDSALWTITQVMWPDRVESVSSSNTARDAIAEAKTALKAGRSRDAQLALLKATVALGNVDGVDGLDDMQQQVQDLWVVASPTPKATATQPDGSSASTTAGTSSDLATPLSSTPSALAPAPLVTASTTSPAAELAGGSVGAPVPPSAPAPVLVPALELPAPGSDVDPSASVPSTEAPAASSAEQPTASEVPPPSSDAPAETTSLPPPEVVQPTAEVVLPASAGQSAPAQSAPAPTPLTQSPEPDPTLDQGTSAVGSVPADTVGDASP
jgi:hypothetical protein